MTFTPSVAQVAMDLFKKSYTAHQKRLLPLSQNQFAPLLYQYEQLLLAPPHPYDHTDAEQLQENLSDMSSILRPDEIQQFLNLTISYEQHPHYSPVTGTFITKLIELSQQRHQQFELNLTGIKPLDFLCFGLAAREDLTVIMRGMIGHHCIQAAEQGTYFIESALNNCGRAVDSATIYIKQAGNYTAQGAFYSQFYIYDTGCWCGTSSKYGNLYINNAGEWCGSNQRKEQGGSEFLTANNDLLTQMQHDFKGVPATLITAQKWDQLWAPAAKIFGDGR